jgi:mRNA interferase RelE/StbE
MSRYEIDYLRDAQKALRAVRDQRVKRMLMEGIAALADTPRPPGCRKLAGRDAQWRIRVGDWRVIYRIDDGRLVVLIVDLGVRGGVYR